LKKQILAVFLVCLAFYAGSFALDQHLRTRRAPWSITFGIYSNAPPTLTIEQRGLGISNVVVVFKGETATTVATRIDFDQPQKPTPFGRRLFEDLTYLPGTLSFDFFGHEVEMLPRVLTLDRREYAWRSGLRIELSPDAKPTPRPPPRKKPVQ